MTTDQILAAIAHTPLARAIAKSDHLVTAAVQSVHVVGFVLLLASLTLIDLRLLGLVLTQRPVSEISRDASRLMWLGVILTVSSGGLLFLTGPSHYYYNPAFDLKMILLLAALLVNVTALQRVMKHDAPPPLQAKIAAILSLILWFGVSWAGRAIGFV